MDASEYIEGVTAQMRCKKARAMVARELADHIEDQKLSYIEKGMEPAEAETEAVRQMGDAVEVGVQMDRIHKPRMDVKLLVIVGIFSVAACFFQNMVFQAQNADGSFFGRISDTVFPVVFGLLLMTGILFLDYTWLGKKPVAVWVALCLLLPVFFNEGMMLIIGNVTLLDYRVAGSISRYVMFALTLPAYGGLIYHYRKKGWKGFILCLVWLGVSAYVNMVTSGRLLFVLMNCLACLLLLTLAVAKKWFTLPRIPALAALWLTIAASVGAFVSYILNFGASYHADRLRAFAMGEASYTTAAMRDILQNLQLVGQGGSRYSLSSAEFPQSSFPWDGASSFLLIADQLGIAAVILVGAGLAVLFTVMAAGVSKQKSVLGGLTAAACLLGLLVPAIFHILNNLTIMPYADAYIPFLYPGWIVNASCYTLLGLYLSVYRNQDVVA